MLLEAVIMEEDKAGTVKSSIELINEIAAISDYRSTVKKQYCNLARRLKLLIPLFEEIRDVKQDDSPHETLKALVDFKKALDSAKELLRFGSEGSRIYMVCECCLISLFFFLDNLIYFW